MLVCAAIAAVLPGDAFTLVLETVPLYLLYEASILIASVVARSDTAQATAAGDGRPPEDPPGASGTPGPPRPSPSDGPDGAHALAATPANPVNVPKTTAQEMIDHIDPELSN
jgi:hypothetical protein